jgi:hypothetical protein
LKELIQQCADEFAEKALKNLEQFHSDDTTDVRQVAREQFVMLILRERFHC